jgi:hydrogenase 3 maturation protease
MKRRYIALDPQGETAFNQRALSNAVWKMIFQLFGEVGASQTALHWVKGSTVTDQVPVIRCSHQAVDMVRAAVAAVTEVEGTRCAIRVIAVSGTLKGLQKKLVKRNVHRMSSIREVEKRVRKWLKDVDRVVVVGIGNELRRDDFVGIKVLKGLKGMVSNRVRLIESETIPESYFEPIACFNPSHILVIDAGLIGLKPSDAKFLESSDFLGPSTAPISTHALPLKIFCDYLQDATNARIAFIIIQPQRTDFGEELSAAVKTTAEKLTEVLMKALPQ